MSQQFSSATEHVKPFPAAADVFGEPLELHLKHLLPLVTVHSSLIFDDLDVWIPFVTSVEPLMELTLGYFTEPFHDEYNKESVIALQRRDERWTFTGDWNYFAYESGIIFESFSKRYQEADIRADYHARFAAYERARNEFLETGEFGRLTLGGDPAPGNWGSQNPCNRSGTPFRFVGELSVPVEGVADWILVFYDPEEHIVLTYFDWS